MKKHFGKMLAVAAAAALALTGCGSGSPSGGAAPAGSEAANGDLTKVVVGVLPIAPSAAVQYGIDKGIFEKHGLDIEFQTSSAGAAMLPAVSTGSINIGIGNPLSTLVAVDKGLDMKIVSGYSNSKAEGDDITGVVVKKDSGINSWKDLADKTVSVNAVNTQGDLTIMEAVEKDGGDPKAVKFSEVAFPDAPAQLERGNIDAAWMAEPFVANALADENNKLLGYNYQDVIPGLPTMVAFTSGKYAQDNPEAVADFKAALAETLDAAEADQEGMKSTVATFLKIDEAKAQAINMEEFSGELRTEQMTKLGELMQKYDFVSKTPDVNAVLVK
ncbi:ABC transporter substrate-binding protein [Arthrobacter sp. USHLN218]|uniref:ABC transporter substrate-binding protein n=1 Tax=Arthrobacter sp. USHLN218 TaxID=3081232 RepID=UPI003017A7EF